MNVNISGEVISARKTKSGGFMQGVLTAPDAEGNREHVLVFAKKDRKIGEKFAGSGRTGRMEQDALFE
jgi:hypothetical protein